jgi:iduronate 2-sulfatase
VEISRQLHNYGKAADANGGELAKPFFLAAGFKRPHLGWFAPESYFDLYANTTVPLALNRKPPKGMPKPAFTGNGEICGMSDVNCTVVDGYKLVPEEKHEELRKAYYSVVSFMDSQLGLVLDALDASGLAASTAMAFWGDHGKSPKEALHTIIL